MSSRFDKMIKDFVNTITEHKESVGPYDTVATVTRIEGDVAYVHIPGGVAETPVKKTINAKVGDEVQIRVSGGSAWIVGNVTAPPTDDTTAVKASGTATKYITDTSNGVFVHKEGDEKNGVKITDGVYIVRDGKIVASYTDAIIVGELDKNHINIDNDSVDIKKGKTLLAEFSGLGFMIYDSDGEIASFSRLESPTTHQISPQLKIKQKNTVVPNIVYETELDGHGLCFNDVGEPANGISNARYTRWGVFYNESGSPVGVIHEGELYQQIEPIYCQNGEFITTHALYLDPGNWLINFGCAFETNANGDRRVVLNNSPTTTSATRKDINVKAASNAPTIVNGTRIVEVSNPNTVFYLHVYHNAGSGYTLQVNPHINAVKLI